MKRLRCRERMIEDMKSGKIQEAEVDLILTDFYEEFGHTSMFSGPKTVSISIFNIV